MTECNDHGYCSNGACVCFNDLYSGVDCVGSKAICLESPANIFQNNLITTLNGYGETYTLEFRIIVKTLPAANTFENVFHFTTGANFGPEGARVPALFIRESSQSFFVGACANGSGNYVQEIPFNLGQEYHFILQHTNGRYMIIVDGDVLYDVASTCGNLDGVGFYVSNNFPSSYEAFTGDLLDFCLSGQWD